MGSMFNTAWSKTQKAATTGVTSGVKASTSLFNFAAGYDLSKSDYFFIEIQSALQSKISNLLKFYEVGWLDFYWLTRVR